MVGGSAPPTFIYPLARLRRSRVERHSYIHTRTCGARKSTVSKLYVNSIHGPPALRKARPGPLKPLGRKKRQTSLLIKEKISLSRARSGGVVVKSEFFFGRFAQLSVLDILFFELGCVCVLIWQNRRLMRIDVYVF
jgi:hypothetical protein